MTPSLKKRFWKTVTVHKSDNGYGIKLDEYNLRTPLKAPLVVPTNELAEMIRTEWDAQIEEVDPMSMPATRIVNATIDTVSVEKQAVIDNLAEYAGSDLLCYRANAPQELVDRQATSWDPILAWAKNKYDAPLNVTQGIIYVDQPSTSLQNLRDQLSDLSIFEISAVHELISISGSYIIGLAVLTNHLSTKDAWHACRIDENYQIEQWGGDEEAEKAANVKYMAFEFAKKYFDACATLT